MSSAACYTNKRRVIAEASITKVQYPGKIANNNDVILSVQNCSPNFDDMRYYTHLLCRKNCHKPGPPEPLFGDILEGGNGSTEPTLFLDGGSGTTESTTIFDGGNS